MMTIQSISGSELPNQPPNPKKLQSKRQKQPGNQSQSKKKPHIRSHSNIKPTERFTPVSGQDIDMNQMMIAEIEHLRNSVFTMEERLQAVEIDRDEWKEKAETLATNFLITMKELKESLYDVKN